MILFVLGLVLKQSSFMPLPQPRTNGLVNMSAGVDPGVWKKARITPEQMASAVDASVKNLHGAFADTKCQIEFAPDGRGTSLGRIFIRDTRTYAIEYPYVERVPRDFEKQTMMAFKGKFGIFTSLGWRRRGPLVSRPRLVPTQSLAEWPFHGGRFLFAAVGSSERPLSQLVSEARKSSLTVKIDERNLVAGGKPVSLWRMTISKPKGLNYEITAVAKLGYPLTLRTTVPKGGKLQKTLFAIRWNFKPSQPFPDDLFAPLLR